MKNKDIDLIIYLKSVNKLILSKNPKKIPKKSLIIL